MIFWKIFDMKWSWYNWSSLLSWNLRRRGAEENHK